MRFYHFTSAVLFAGAVALPVQDSVVSSKSGLARRDDDDKSAENQANVPRIRSNLPRKEFISSWTLAENSQYTECISQKMDDNLLPESERRKDPNNWRTFKEELITAVPKWRAQCDGSLRAQVRQEEIAIAKGLPPPNRGQPQTDTSNIAQNRRIKPQQGNPTNTDNENMTDDTRVAQRQRVPRVRPEFGDSSNRMATTIPGQQRNQGMNTRRTARRRPISVNDVRRQFPPRQRTRDFTPVNIAQEIRRSNRNLVHVSNSRSNRLNGMISSSN